MFAEFQYDVFLSHSAEDKAAVRSSSLSASNGERAGVRCRRFRLAERLRTDGLLNNSQPSTFNSQPPRGSDWAQLESGTFGRGNLPFSDPLNKERRFLPLRLDDATTNDSDWFRKDDDVRWQFGVPPKGNASFAWVQHFIHHLAPHGMAGFVLDNGSMSSNQSGEGDIRRALIEADREMPSGELLPSHFTHALLGQLFYSTQVPDTFPKAAQS